MAIFRQSPGGYTGTRSRRFDLLLGRIGLPLSSALLLMCFGGIALAPYAVAQEIFAVIHMEILCHQSNSLRKFEAERIPPHCSRALILRRFRVAQIRQLCRRERIQRHCKRALSQLYWRQERNLHCSTLEPTPLSLKQALPEHSYRLVLNARLNRRMF